jgi:hypothetical protein
MQNGNKIITELKQGIKKNFNFFACLDSKESAHARALAFEFS